MTTAQQVTQSSAQSSAGITIRGTVHDSSGNAVADASVRLEQTGNSDTTGVADAIRAQTNAQGVFTFSALRAGNYTLSAEKSGLRSHPDRVVARANEDGKPIDLVLDRSIASAPTMEFADTPNFTVAGVTDWTAVGGHGSDTSLRTSEALTRETLTLKPQIDEPQTDEPKIDGHNASVRGDSHRIAAELAEKSGDPLAAVHEFEQAVRLDPSEQNYFAWGSELLLHRAVWQAQEVFEKGVGAYPKSARMLTALGTALFAGARYDEAAQRLCAASDLNPADAEPYLFMGKVAMAAPNPLPCVDEKLARFASQRPDNSLADYFYAMALWKLQQQTSDANALAQVERLLTKAVTIDPKCSDGYLQLGILKSSQQDYRQAIDFYRKAIEANPQLGEAHYRLGVAYDRIGEAAEAKREFRLHEEIEKTQAAAIERERREVKQFQVVQQGQPVPPPAR